MSKKVNRYSKITALVDIFPYFVFSNENIKLSMEYRQEIIEIKEYYNVYNRGADFTAEGNAGHYISSDIRYKTNKNLIDKQARFMFSHIPDINIFGEPGEENEQIEIYKKVINSIIEKNNFGQKLLEAAKDCFIGKRVACLVDMSEQSGVMFHFYSSLEFYYERDYRSGEITKFISFENVSSAKQRADRLYIINRYEMSGENVTVFSALYSGNGEIVETYVPEHKTDLKEIPVVVIINSGTIRDRKGVSDLRDTIEYETGYSRIANAEIDTDRKGMNPVRYTVDMNQETTKYLPSGPGAYWDLQHNSVVNDPKPMIGTLSPNMNHTEPIKAVLDRLRASMYEAMDVPDISKEGLLSGITSYKALKALYYPLMNRSDEKLVVWKPAIQKIIRIAIELAVLNENVTKTIYSVPDVKEIPYHINIVENYAIIDDETEEKQLDMEEIATKARSRFSYLKKWRGEELKTDDEVKEELLRIAEEENMMDTLSMNAQIQNRLSDEETGMEVEQMVEDTNTI